MKLNNKHQKPEPNHEIGTNHSKRNVYDKSEFDVVINHCGRSVHTPIAILTNFMCPKQNMYLFGMKQWFLHNSLKANERFACNGKHLTDLLTLASKHTTAMEKITINCV